jgi:7-cyano-7-deazaguanine synthase
MLPKVFNSTALVVFSGGQDSTTCLFWAKNRFSRIVALGFDYGQRHRIELKSASAICQKYEVPFEVLPIDTLAALGGNSLLDASLKIETTSKGLPNTFVPGRNLIFLTYAAAKAYQLGIQHLVTGVCQTDYSGYPDCRRNTLDALEQSISLGMESQFTIHTPLMSLTKAESVHLAQSEGALAALAYSHTCYEGVYPPCGCCPACILRAKGFAEAGISDPLLVRAGSLPK